MALSKTTTSEKKDAKEKKSMKQVGPILEVSATKSGEKKIAKKLIVAGGTTNNSTAPPSTVPSKTDTTDKELRENDGSGFVNLNDSFIVCSHIAEQVDVETLKSIAKKNGVDLEHTPEEQKKMRKEMKRKIKLWKKCPCRMDFRNVCRDGNGQPCPVVQAFMTPQPLCPDLLSVASHLPPGTIGVSRRQVAFHTGGPFPNSNDPHQLELGRRTDGTMCVSVQYSPDPPPPPEYICTTVRETQATSDEPARKTTKKGGKASKSKKGKKK